MRIVRIAVAFSALVLFSSLASAADEEWIALFNGRDLTGWTPKITHYELGNNFANTFRVENGLLKVRYDGYQDGFNTRFGHLFYAKPYSYYRLRVRLQVAAGEVVADCVTVDMVECLRRGDVPSTLTDRHHQLDLVVEVVRARGIRDARVARHDGIGRLGEEERRLPIGVRAHFARVRGVVAADAVDAMDGELVGTAFDGDRGNGGWEEVGHGAEMYRKAQSG